MKQVSLPVVAALLLISGPLIADDIVVPDEFVTIQGAVDFASSGDRIWVRSGTYVENILVLGKSIHLTSFDGSAVTIIDGSAPTRPDTLSVITAIGADDFVLAGFTLRNAHGGIDFGEQSGDDSGGGLACGATNGAVRNCVIEDNFCGGSGGGAHLVLSDLLIEDCIVRYNECGLDGGGIHTFLGSPSIQRCRIENNRGGEGGAGGGICLRFFGSPQIADCVISGNRARGGAGIAAQEGSSPTILRTLITGNSAATYGAVGGVQLNSGSPRIEGCTVVGNFGPGNAGISFVTALPAVLSHSIVAFNQGGRGLSCVGGTLAVSCCDLFGNEEGDEFCGIDAGGNFSLDPLFCADYSIAESSPCAPANAPVGCGLIGARDVGCTGAIEASTWGRIKVRLSVPKTP